LLLLRILVDIEGAEPLRQIEIDLRRAALPFTPDGVLQDIIELRTVESPIAGIDGHLDAVVRARDLLQHLRHDAFGMIPESIRTNALFWPRGQEHLNFLETEIRIGGEDQPVDLEALFGKLVFGTE